MNNFIHGRHYGMTDAVVLSGIAEMPEGPAKQEAFALVLGRSEVNEAAAKILRGSEDSEGAAVQV